MSDLLNMFIKKELLQGLSCLAKINLKEPKNLIEPKKFQFSFNVRAELKKLSNVKDSEILQFKTECILMLKELCIKLQTCLLYTSRCV